MYNGRYTVNQVSARNARAEEVHSQNYLMLNNENLYLQSNSLSNLLLSKFSSHCLFMLNMSQHDPHMRSSPPAVDHQSISSYQHNSLKMKYLS